MTDPKQVARRPTAPTAVMGVMPTVVVVGCSPSMNLRCWTIASGLGAIVVEAPIAEVTNVAARTRPLAIVIAEALFEFDPIELEALARDVRSSLVVLADEDLSDDELTGKVLAAISESKRRRSE